MSQNSDQIRNDFECVIKDVDQDELMMFSIG